MIMMINSPALIDKSIVELINKNITLWVLLILFVLIYRSEKNKRDMYKLYLLNNKM